MALPNLSYMMSVGQLRYIQSAYEVPEHRNPDALIQHFLSATDLWRCRLRGLLILDRLRKNPFYYYVLARTRYYDKVFSSAISGGVKHIVNIGCGSDTRAYRFATELIEAGVSCLECDQEAAIVNKKKLARAKLDASHVQFMSVDLNQADWSDLESWFSARQGDKFLVMLEGVSPYIDEKAFYSFLSFLSARLEPGSRLAYDFKLKGVADGFGQAQPGHVPFRLSSDAYEVAAVHKGLGFTVEQFSLGTQLVERTIQGRLDAGLPLFAEDALVQLSVAGTA